MPRAWLYYGGTIAYQLIAMVVLFALFPGVIEVVNERGNVNKQGVKTWDRVFGVCYFVLLLVLPAVAGPGTGWFHRSEVPALLALPALIVTILVCMFVHGAMIVNKHAETGVRIQEDRRHQVVSRGPVFSVTRSTSR